MTIPVSYPVDALVSYHYYADDEAMLPLVNSGRLRLIGDSGAFSALTQGARIELGEYAKWVERWREHLLWAASLDVIGDPVASYRNWLELRDRYGVEVVPTVHAGAHTSWIDAYASQGATLLGLGGLVGKSRVAFPWSVKMFRHARDHWPDIRFHLWGAITRQYLDNLPAWSADSSSVLMQPYAYGRLNLFDPTTTRHVPLALDGKMPFKYATLIRQYGTEPAAIKTSHPGNRYTLIRLAVSSTQRYAAWLQRRHRVTPPALLAGRTDGPTGPRVHGAGGEPGRRGHNDLTMAVDASAGPRLHGVDTYGEHLRGAVDEGRFAPGPRLHGVDGYPEHLKAIVDQGRYAPTEPPEAGPSIHAVNGLQVNMIEPALVDDPPGPHIHTANAGGGPTKSGGCDDLLAATNGPLVATVGGGPSPGSNANLLNLFDRQTDQ